MPATTLTAIIGHVQTTLEAAPVSLTRSQLPFSHDRQPNAVVDNVYWVEDGGQVSRQSGTNHFEVRIDRLVVYVAARAAFAGTTPFTTMSTLLDTIYKQLVEMARANGYNVEADGTRKITQKSGSEILIGSVGLSVDYDFDATPA